MLPARLWRGLWMVRQRLTRLRTGVRGSMGPLDRDPLGQLIAGDLESFPDLRGKGEVWQKN